MALLAAIDQLIGNMSLTECSSYYVKQTLKQVACDYGLIYQELKDRYLVLNYAILDQLRNRLLLLTMSNYEILAVTVKQTLKHVARDYDLSYKKLKFRYLTTQAERTAAARQRWGLLKASTKLLSLHKRGVIRANHPEAKFLRGEFEE